MAAAGKTRVLVISDYPTVRADLRTILELVEGVEVVGEAAVTNTIHLPATAQSDIILIDLDMVRRKTRQPDRREVVRKFSIEAPEATIYILTTASLTAEAGSALPDRVADAFVKGIDTERLLDCIRNFRSENERKVEMQATRERSMKVVEQAKAVALPQVKFGSRLAYIDTLRMVLIVLVIMVHAAVTYGSLGEWTYEDPAQDELSAIILSFFVIDCQAFFMGLYFFFAGYFTPGAYDRKGIGKFWKDRLLRLGLPMLAYTYILSRIPNYIDAVANEGMQSSFGQFFISTFWTDADEGPTWFLFALLAFSLGYTLWRLVTRKARLANWLSKLPVPKTGTLLAVALVFGAFTFAILQWLPLGEMFDVFGVFSLQLQFFPTYIILFIAGMLAYRSDWLTKLPGKPLRFWGWLSAGLVVSLPLFFYVGGAVDGKLDYFMSGMHWQSVATGLWLGLAAVAFSMTLTLWLRGRVSANNKLAAFVSPNNYAVYLIHPLVLVPVTLGLSYFALAGLVKFGIASIITVIVCYGLATGIRRIPGLKSIL
ncbi:MAG TPA: hypothetical protein DCP32_06635 [Anaerolineaceae bacterium]|nr:hypothetical protein [Anaerolineaceae bacterium]